MRLSALGQGAMISLALAAGACGIALADGVATEGAFRLLKLGGHHVKWGEPSLGSGASVTYAFVGGQTEFASARNCNTLMPMDDLMTRSGISEETLRVETTAAFRLWEAAADIVFIAVEDPAHADILIGAQGEPVGRAFANVAYRSDGGAEVKAIDQSLICLNAAQRWKVGFDGDTDVAYDIRYTLAHEIGHAIGLDHPSPAGQLMSFKYEETFRHLQPGDLRGVAELYGHAAENTLAITLPADTEAESRADRNELSLR